MLDSPSTSRREHTRADCELIAPFFNTHVARSDGRGFHGSSRRLADPQERVFSKRIPKGDRATLDDQFLQPSQSGGDLGVDGRVGLPLRRRFSERELKAPHGTRHGESAAHERRIHQFARQSRRPRMGIEPRLSLRSNLGKLARRERPVPLLERDPSEHGVANRVPRGRGERRPAVHDARWGARCASPCGGPARPSRAAVSSGARNARRDRPRDGQPATARVARRHTVRHPIDDRRHARARRRSEPSWLCNCRRFDDARGLRELEDYCRLTRRGRMERHRAQTQHCGERDGEHRQGCRHPERATRPSR
jgi:hypothetical protein